MVCTHITIGYISSPLIDDRAISPPRIVTEPTMRPQQWLSRVQNVIARADPLPQTLDAQRVHHEGRVIRVYPYTVLLNQTQNPPQNAPNVDVRAIPRRYGGGDCVVGRGTSRRTAWG